MRGIQKVVLVFAAVFLWCGGYYVGKGNANRWWQAHQATVTHLYPGNHQGHILRVCSDAVHCTDYSVLPRCPEWDNSCGFKPGDWDDSDNTYCYDANGKPCEGFSIKQGEFAVCGEHGCKKLEGGGACLGPDGYGHPCKLGDVNIQIDNQIQEIKKEIDKRSQWEALQGAAIGLLVDCSNVDTETWNKRNCAQRKAKWEKGAKKFQ